MGRRFVLRRKLIVAVAAAATIAGAGAASSASLTAPVRLPVVDPTVAPNRAVEPVVMIGADFPGIAVPQNATAKAPFTDLVDCPPGSNTNGCAHNDYSPPTVDTSGVQNQLPIKGVYPNQLLGYHWQQGPHGGKFVQIPFQVDKVFTRYLENDASGFAIYSGADQHTTYQWQNEGFRAYPDPNDPCHALYKPPAKDPIPYFDTNDEVSFMYSDSGDAAPQGAKLPKGIQAMRAVQISDPLRPSAPPKYVYVMIAAPNGPKAAYNASNGYVRYLRDPTADEYVFSQSDYSNYGNAPTGDICGAPSPGHPYGTPILDSHGNPVIARHRPLDTATVMTPRYDFRYDGRWLMTGIGISPDNRGLLAANFGPNVVDRWKARAFAQDPSSKTPCCGFEEEDTHWGGSSTLMGELVGPVRAIRATWGADSGTNVVRMETFYADQMRMKNWLRVHVIPPLDGIYAQWDFRAGRMTRYYNPNVPNGVAVDGRNDTVFGNLDDPCNPNYNGMNEGTGVQNPLSTVDPNQPGTIDPNQVYRQAYQGAGICSSAWPYHQSVNVADPTFEGLNSSLQWNETAGPWGTIVDRYQVDQVTDLTPGGVAQSMLALPYYRDDSCFDDGTGSDPGPRVNPGSSNEPRTYVDPATGTTKPRTCWHPPDPIPTAGDQQYFQGDIGTHGLHLMFQVESDNARQQVPIDEIVSDQRMVMLPGQQPNVGEQYGREFEKPLVVRVRGGGLGAGSVGG